MNMQAKPEIEETCMKYKRVVFTHIGGPEVLQMLEGEVPEPKAGEVRVKLLATGLHS